MNKISVVIPFYNHWELTHQAMFDLYSFCRESIYEVVVVNDGSTEVECYTGLQWWKDNHLLTIKRVETEENLGFLMASNMGIKWAKGDIVAILSNDVRIHEDIFKEIDRILATEPNSLIGGKLYQGSTGWNEFDGKIFPYLEGWLLAATSEGWKTLGGFDERYAPNDYEDVDLSTTAISKGFTLHELAYAKINHIGAQSIGYSPDREIITRNNREKFKRKWITQQN